MKIERRWLRVSEAGEYLALHPKSVYRACRNHRIPSAKAPGIGVRVDKIELDLLLERMGLKPEEFGRTVKEQEDECDES